MTSTAHQNSFEQLGLGSVLKRYLLAVPPNQREYRWGDKQVRQLFQDFAKAIDVGDYFLGTIVTIPQPSGTLQIVDGQQRLATTAILLAAIRDYLQGKNESILVESINNEFLTGIDRTKRQRVPKLTLNVDDNDLFSSIVTGVEDLSQLLITNRESHTLLMNARKLAAEHVRNITSILDAKDHGDLLEKWVSFVENRALVVLLQVSDSADAFKMFETLNDRGLRTSQADLIKNYLFGRSNERFREVQSRWTYMRGALESLGEDDITIDFLRHALVVISGFVREAEVYERVQETVRGQQGAVNFSTTLENFAYSYVATFNPEHERWNGYPDSARRAIEVFDLFNIKPMRPLILAITHSMDAKEAAKAFGFLMTLGMRLLIASSTRSGSVEGGLADAAHAVYERKITSVSGLKKALASTTPSDVEFKEAFETCRVSNQKLARYYLRSLELAAKGETEPWFVPYEDRSVINLEHVLPKKPEGKWPQFTPDEAENYVNRLGNQALLRSRDNAELRSAPFSEKKKVYAKSPYVLTKQIAEADDWTPTTIGNRQKSLASWSLKAWPLS